ncbi:efflux RND transporter periplasmic adaptor subunit [Mucilaginibacter sp. McL0603]|uniref:efflux RND transporter periplasmic adaptor subunit n=1 Tax=Mucilaginibacter sp. McL0603 TaxID=3415670 RepID=UPI003CFB7185
MKINYIVLFSLFLAACSTKQKEKNQDKKDAVSVQQQQPKDKSNAIIFTPEKVKNGGIDTGHIPMHRLAASIHVNGQVDVPPENLIAVNIPFGGFLKSTTMLPGEPVRKGQVIAEVENQDYITLQQDYLTAASKTTFLKQELERQRVLSAQQASPLKLYQQSLADFNSQQAQLCGLAQKLIMLGINPQKLTPAAIKPIIYITSPITGYVSKVNVNIGKYVNPTDVLMELVNTDDIHAALTVYEQDIAKIAIGNSVKINLPGIPDKTYPGKVILIGRMLDTGHSVMVHCHFLKTDKNILPNMFLQATIETRPQNTLAVPEDAIVNYGGQRCMFMSTLHGKDILFNMIPVNVGVQQDGWCQIQLSKPELKDRSFVLKGAFSILSAMKNVGDNDN